MTEGTQTYMPVVPAYNGGDGFGGSWGGDFWLILILLFAFGGWGGNGFGSGAWGMDGLYPWMNNAQITTNGFQNQALGTAISGLQNSVSSGFGDVQLGIAGINQNLCQTGNGIVQAVNNGFSQAEIANNSRQIANMQQAFAQQTATSQGFNSLQSQLAQCCCDNRLATAQTQALVQSENCADRAALSDGIRDIIDSNTRNTQAILDKLCQQEIDALKTQNNNLQTQVLMRDLAASQASQTAQIEAGQRSLANEVEQYIAPNPKPAYIVQSPYCCNQAAYGCGCGM